MVVKAKDYQKLEDTLYILLEELENGTEFYNEHPGFNDIECTSVEDWYRIPDELLTDGMVGELQRYYQVEVA